MTQISLAAAIAQIRNQLRDAILESPEQDIVFTPRMIELELGVNFSVEAEVSGGLKLLAFLDLSTKAKSNEASQHKLKLVLDVADAHGEPLKVRSSRVPREA